MFDLKYFIIFALFSVLSCVYTQSQNDNVLGSNNLEQSDVRVNFSDCDTYWTNNQVDDGDRVEVKLYYESLCPDCIKFDKEQFSVAVQKLSQYVDFHTYPYGNAKTIKENGVIEFQCQHGPPECYGNKLQACAIDNLENTTEAFVYNTCMMGGSDDAAADKCAASLGIDSTTIKECAKGDRGTELLEYYGEESKKANFSYVPYILINGKENNGSDFLRDICTEFVVTPPPCVEYSLL